MADNLSKEVRHYNMTRIKNKNTRPEELVRKYLFSKGLRYRKNDRRFPGKPDIVFPKYRAIVFVNGCFWHMHDGCRDFVFPKSNQEYWLPKLLKNKSRDVDNITTLRNDGWNVIVVWECELKKPHRQERLELLYLQITTPPAS